MTYSDLQPCRVHIIAVGGAVMHNVALALHRAGWQVSGSDDEIFEPSKSRLAQAGILPAQFGWFPENLTSDIELVVLGMHAKGDNPELLRAQQLGLKIVSFPEFFALNSLNKQRVAIAGSHGKTTTTSMVLHVLRTLGKDFDFLVGASIPDFDLMVRISTAAPVLVVEADEYLTSPIDSRPKFIWYKPHISVITGIAWDHMNVFPTEEIYQQQFRLFLDTHPDGATVVFCEDDAALVRLVEPYGARLNLVPYRALPYEVERNQVVLTTPYGRYPLSFFGRHNLSNAAAAREVCARLGIAAGDFYRAISTFRGAKMRLETVAETESLTIIRDFAHAPSKVAASAAAARERYPDRKLVCAVELHTFSSLSHDFLPQYAGSLDPADAAVVFFDPHAVELKRLTPLDPDWIVRCFNRPGLTVARNRAELEQWLRAQIEPGTTLLAMSSGSWGGLDLKSLAHQNTA